MYNKIFIFYVAVMIIRPKKVDKILVGFEIFDKNFGRIQSELTAEYSLTSY